jgi:GntR family transcriptional regulator, uxu operon transcriptional repressor
LRTPADLNGDELARRILREAEDAGMRVGGRLPTERTLADDLGVSRTVVRHALARLEAAGAISREVGRGTFIRRFDPTATPGDDVVDVTDVGPADVMTVRLLLEPQAMPIVVARATGRDFEEMQRCLAGGESADTYADFELWDLALHRCLMAASHNPLLLRLYACVETARHGQLWGDLKRRNDSMERRVQYRAQHHLVVDALRTRDSDAAVAAMQAHLSTVRANLLGSNA